MFVVTIDGESKEWSLLEWALFDTDTRGVGKEWTIAKVEEDE